MPYKSDAQRRFFHAAEDRGDISSKVVNEFDEASKGKKLPDHVKKDEKMADGGVPEEQEQAPVENPIDAEHDKFVKDVSVSFKEGINHDSDAVRSYLSSKFHQLLSPTPDSMAQGGVPGVTFLENVSAPEVRETIHLEETPSKNEELAAKGHEEHYAHGGTIEKSDDDKRDEIYRAMGMGKYAKGGVTLQPPVGPVVPDQTDPSFWEKVKTALAQVAAPVTKPIGAMADVAANATQAATPALQAAAPGLVSAVNEGTGLNLPVPEAPKAIPEGAPTPMAAPVPQPLSVASPALPVQPQVTKSAPIASSPDLKNLFNQDTSKLTEGVEGADRQQVAARMAEGQGGVGSVIAQALAGLGDALAAKGGREQHSLKDIFTLQKQQRDEALTNFDKARQARLEQLDLQTKMGNNAINQLAAQDAYGVDEGLNKQLGAPPGTKHKDLPLYMQMASAKVGQQEKDADLYMKAHKQAADEIEAAVKSASMFSIKPSAAQMQAQGAKLADTYYNRAKGNILFKPSDGQPAVWIPAKNIAAAKKMDPNGQIVQ